MGVMYPTVLVCLRRLLLFPPINQLPHPKQEETTSLILWQSLQQPLIPPQTPNNKFGKKINEKKKENVPLFT
jgi:hypothetical protein